jgi:antitoxin (DNA-binding transcriptional repressor) of toxin-antitoxin stability system
MEHACTHRSQLASLTIVHRCTRQYNWLVTTTMTVSEARAALPDIIERVLGGDEVTLTRHGIPVVVIVRPDTLRSRRSDDVVAAADALRSTIDGARRRSLDDSPGISPERADALVAAVHADRRRR